VKCREIALVYQLPDKLAAKTHVFQDMTISFTGRDLFYLYTTSPDNINPEGSIGAGNAQGLEFASLPGMRSIGLSLNMAF
jgi:iron complex outermembrane receptor protein